MKQIDYNFRGTRGSIPPQLFKYIDMSDMAGETKKFTDYINAIAYDFILKEQALHPDGKLTDAIKDITLNAPKLFGHDVTLEYIGHGTYASVYKMNVGEVVFALKINFVTKVVSDIRAIEEHKRARNLINRPYIGATFGCGGLDYSWVLSDYVERDYENSFVDAKEKLFYATITKGVRYSDMHPLNVKNGRIIDLGGIEHMEPRLPRVEIDMVKKFMDLMRKDDEVSVRALADKALARHPNVINYLYIKMAMHQMEMPMRLQKFKKIIGEYNTRRLRAMRDAAAAER